jgi:hypothetical protein
LFDPGHCTPGKGREKATIRPKSGRGQSIDKQISIDPENRFGLINSQIVIGIKIPVYTTNVILLMNQGIMTGRALPGTGGIG